MVEFSSKQALKQGRESKSLIIKQGLFTKRRLSNLTEEQLTNEKRVLRVNLLHEDENQKLPPYYYKQYYTYPFKLKSSKEKTPNTNPAKTAPLRGTKNSFNTDVLYGVEPIFTELDSNYFEDSFKLLDKALNGGATRLNPVSFEDYNIAIENALIQRPSLENNDPEEAVKDVFKSSVVKPCLELFEYLQADVSLHTKYRVDYDVHCVYPDILIANKTKGTNLLLVEFKKVGLENFIKDGRLVETNKDFNSIIEQVTTYLIVSNLDECLITDFKVSIYLRHMLEDVENLKAKYPTLTKEVPTKTPKEGEEPEKKKVKYVKVPYGYRIIRNTDCGVTLQAVVASMMYREAEFNPEGKSIPEDEPKPKGKPKPNVKGKAWDDIPENNEDKDDDDDENYKGSTKKQVKRLKVVLTKNGTDQRQAASDMAKVQTTRIINSIQNSRMYQKVDKSKFKETVVVDLDEKLVPIRTGSNYLSQVYLLDYEKYIDFFKTRDVPENIPQKVILKVYDFTQLENYTKEYIQDLKCNSSNDLYNVEDTYNYAASLMLNEISCYERIQSSNENIRTPKLYDYGVIRTQMNGYPVFTGYYLLMTNIEETEEDKKLQEIIQMNTKEETSIDELVSVNPGATSEETNLVNQIKDDLIKQKSLLEKIGVYHNDLVSRNLVLRNATYTIIDFSHGAVTLKRRLESD